MLISKKLHETSTFLKKVANFHYKLSDFSTRSEKGAVKKGPGRAATIAQINNYHGCSYVLVCV